MTVAAAADEFKHTITKKSGSAITNWSHDDDTAPGALDAVLLMNSPSVDRIIDKILDDAMGGETAQGDVLNGGVRAEFPTINELRYDDGAGHLPLFLFMGTSGGTPSTPSAVTGSTVRDQYLTPALNLNGLVASICRGPTTSHGSDQPSASVCPSAMAHSLALRSESAGVLSCEVGWRGIDVFKVPAPSDDPLAAGITLNANRTNIAAATISSTSQRILHGDLEFFIDVESGSDDFAGGSGQDHVIQVSRLELTAERDQTWPDYGSQPANAADAVSRPLMPANSAQKLVPQLVIELPRWGNDTHWGRWATNVSYRIRAEWTGDQIESGYNRRFRIDMPSAKLITPVKNLGGNVTQTLTFNLYQAASTPAGFSSADFLRFDLRNEQASDLAA